MDHRPGVGRLLVIRIFVMALLALPAATAGQTIVGRVVEEGRRAPVSGAQVTVLRGEREERTSALSDSLGAFRLNPGQAGMYRLRVRHLAFKGFDSAPLEVGAGETVSVLVRLSATAIPLDPVLVTVRTRNSRLAEFEERRLTHSAGRFLAREDIERRNATRVTELLRGLPGVQVSETRARGGSRARYLLRVRGASASCEPAIFIDGLAVRQLPESTIDEMLSPATLDGVEIYTSSAGAPARYQVQGSCGVFLFWTGGGRAGPNKWSWKAAVGGLIAAAAIAIILSR